MANLKNISKTVTKPTDDYLKFVQQSFNTGDTSFNEIIKQLDAFSNSSLIFSRMQKGDLERAVHAKHLRQQLNNIIILRDPDKYNKFDKLGNFGLDSKGLIEVYKVSDEIIKDIQVARDWISSYKAFNNLYKNIDLGDMHKELIVLGQSILGRAIELAPMKTGTLRQSGILMDFGTYIIIAFTAPYATYVHENLAIAHPSHPSNPNCGGRAKFLEIALQEFFPDRTVWTEQLGKSDVSVKIGINPLWLEYTHYGS